VRLPLLLSLWLILTAAAPVETGPVMLCPTPVPGTACAPVDLTSLHLQGEQAVLVRIITISPDALPLERPLAVRLTAMASAEISWNGVLVGRNGIPGADASSEEPGRFIAGFSIPAQLLRPGENILSARLSSHHLWLPVLRPVHEFHVEPYAGEELPGLSTYLPALLVLGALAAACIYFSASWWGERRDKPAARLAAIAVLAMIQLGAEVSRAFLAYTYPWHLARVSLIALLAALISVLLASYAASRFAPHRRRAWVTWTAIAAAASLLLVPWFDLKALSAILAAAVAVAAAGASAVRRGDRLGWLAIAFSTAIPLLIAWQLTGFLDRAWFILLAVALVALVAEQVQTLRRARAERDAERRRSVALAERLAKAESQGEPILALKDGSRTHRVAESDILLIRAADDYCEAQLRDGRTMLVTMNLTRLLAVLPRGFVRVHKSYAVNRPHVIGLVPRPGGGRLLRLSDGSEVPVGRSYAERVAASFS
jgi:DNA-binding LytR/AlgR family response regulator